MKILNLTREAAELQLSINELVIIKNSLMEAYQQLTVADFRERIRGISKDDSLQFASTIGEIIDLFQQNSAFTPENQFIQSIQLIEDSVALQLTYELLLGLRSVLNELCHGIYVVQDFQNKIGFDKASVFYILDSIHFDIVQKMEEGIPQNLIFNKSREISKNLNLNLSNLEAKSLFPRVKTECVLNLKSHLIVFFLASLSNRKIFSGIQIAIGKPSHQPDSFTKSDVQGIRHSDLVRLVAYLELVLTSVISDADLEKFTLSLFDSTKNPLFDIQIFSRCIDSEDLKIRFRLYPSIQKNNVNNRCSDIEDTSNVSDIYSFTLSIREFLSKLPKKESDNTNPI